MFVVGVKSEVSPTDVQYVSKCLDTISIFQKFNADKAKQYNMPLFKINILWFVFRKLFIKLQENSCFYLFVHEQYIKLKVPIYITENDWYDQPLL